MQRFSAGLVIRTISLTRGEGGREGATATVFAFERELVVVVTRVGNKLIYQFVPSLLSSRLVIRITGHFRGK